MRPEEEYITGKLRSHLSRRNTSWYARVLARRTVNELRLYRQTHNFRSLRRR